LYVFAFFALFSHVLVAFPADADVAKWRENKGRETDTGDEPLYQDAAFS
jgi:hypothetical protein